MELVGGIGVFVILIIGGLHAMLPKYPNVRLVLCICLAVGLCFTGTMHGVLLAIGLVFVEAIVNKVISLCKTFIQTEQND